jgi:sugar lactone lactonase YvrE
MARREAFAVLLGWTVAAGLVASCGGGAEGSPQVQAGQPCGAGPCVSTVAGSGDFGTLDGPAESAQFFMPHAVAVDAMSQLHVADFGGSNQTRLIRSGQVSTLAEDPIDFPHPSDTAVDALGNRFVADTHGHRILKITPAGQKSVVAGTGENGAQDGAAASASFSLPTGLAFDASGALFVADMGNRRIRKITFGAGAAG